MVDWHELFVPTQSIASLVLRGSTVYFVLFLAMRYFLKRNAGEIGIADILVIVLLTEATQNALVGEARSLTEGTIIVAVILAWTHVLNWLSFRFPRLRHLTGAAPLRLIENGRLLRRNMQREMITFDELATQLREQGIERVAQVKLGCLEGDGGFSFIRFDEGETADGAPARTSF